MFFFESSEETRGNLLTGNSNPGSGSNQGPGALRCSSACHNRYQDGCTLCLWGSEDKCLDPLKENGLSQGTCIRHKARGLPGTNPWLHSHTHTPVHTQFRDAKRPMTGEGNQRKICVYMVLVKLYQWRMTVILFFVSFYSLYLLSIYKII